MATRKQITKALRFEVFKRDSFTCQYCGKMSPDVILEVDHLSPVSKGGKNDIMNLVTACFDCNRGKSDKELSDDSVITKQQRQLAEINERRMQMQMMLEWRSELQLLEETQVNAVDKLFLEWFEWELISTGRRHIKSLIKRFGFSEVYESTTIAIERYDTADEAYRKIGGICYNRLHGITGERYAK